MMKISTLILCIALSMLLGCQTNRPKPASQTETTSQIVSALGTVTEGLTNQNIDQKDLRNLAVQVQKDPNTKSAVESINQALSAQQKGVKYCPVDGQRFSSSVDICPIHKVKLKLVE